MNFNHLVEIVDSKLSAVMDISRDYSDLELRELISQHIEGLKLRISLSENEERAILNQVFNNKRKLGILQPLLEDISINEIMINGTNNIYIEQEGKIKALPLRFDSRDKLFNLVQSIISRVNRTVNESNPIVDARLEDGSRINVVLNPIAINGPIVSIRKFSDKAFTMDRFIELGTLSEQEAEFLIEAVKRRLNIFISGGTSSGKTTFLNVLSQYISKNERVVTIEDSAELMLNLSNLVRLETREANSEGKGEVDMRSLIKASLRMRPDRIIVGEVRDASALDMLQALNTGHDGSMSTGHANSPRDMLLRIETLALWEGHINSEAIRRQMASAIDLIVHLKRNELMERKLAEISELSSYRKGDYQLNTLFKDGKKISDMKEKAYKYGR